MFIKLLMLVTVAAVANGGFAMGSPIDRTAKTALDTNLVNGITSDAPKVKGSNDTLYNYVDALNAAQDSHAAASVLPHADGSVTGPKIKDGAIGTNHLANGVITRQRIATGAVGASELDPTLLQNYGDIAVQAEFQKVAKYTSQADFVQVVKDRVAYSNLSFRKIDNARFNVYMDDGNNSVSYDFIKDTNDDFFKINDGFVGGLGEVMQYPSGAPTLTGAWNTASPPNYYTTTLNDTFTATAKGKSLKFRHFADNRGGIFEITVDGGAPVTISTWSETAIVVEDVIATGLNENTLHTVVGTFKGADPLHAPVGGTARGWVSHGTNSPEYSTLKGYVNGNTNTKSLLGTGSNKEMAISIKSGNTSYFVPDHGVGVAFNAEPMKILVDQKEIDFNNLTDILKANASIDIIQHCYIDIPGITGHAGEFYLRHHLDKRGSVSYSGTLKALQNITIDVAYPLMIALRVGVLDKALTAIGNTKINDSSETIYTFEEEKNRVFSAAGVSETNKDYIAAGTVGYPLKSLRLGEITAPTQVLSYWQRASAPKIYFAAGTNWPMVANQKYCWNGEIIVANINNIHDYVTN